VAAVAAGELVGEGEASPIGPTTHAATGRTVIMSAITARQPFTRGAPVIARPRGRKLRIVTPPAS
jgi:hypothetical protein